MGIQRHLSSATDVSASNHLAIHWADERLRLFERCGSAIRFKNLPRNKERKDIWVAVAITTTSKYCTYTCNEHVNGWIAFRGHFGARGRQLPTKTHVFANRAFTPNPHSDTRAVVWMPDFFAAIRQKNATLFMHDAGSVSWHSVASVAPANCIFGHNEPIIFNFAKCTRNNRSHFQLFAINNDVPINGTQMVMALHRQRPNQFHRYCAVVATANQCLREIRRLFWFVSIWPFPCAQMPVKNKWKCDAFHCTRFWFIFARDVAAINREPNGQSARDSWHRAVI